MAVHALIADDAIEKNVKIDGREVGDDGTSGDPIIAPSVKPALSPSVHLSLTIVYTVLYGLLFLFVYIQLWKIYIYRHKRLSYQTVFLFLCLIWAALRTTLFTFYFSDCAAANSLSVFLEWLLYCFPVCLQFTTICLLVMYFAQLVFKSTSKYGKSHRCGLITMIFLSNLIFFIVNILSEFITFYNKTSYSAITITVIQVRVAINDSLFLIYAVSLAVCIYRMSRMSSVSNVLEDKGTSRCQALSACAVIVLLFASRALYNMLAIYFPSIPGFGYDWINVSDQADLTDLKEGYAFASFGCVLFFWEFLPTFVVVIFFRVRKPGADEPTDEGEPNRNSRAYFFDNPRRYDSDEDLSRSSRHINYSSHHRSSLNDVSSSPYAISDSLMQSRLGTPRSNTWSTRFANYRSMYSSSFSGHYNYFMEQSPPLRHDSILQESQ